MSTQATRQATAKSHVARRGYLKKLSLASLPLLIVLPLTLSAPRAAQAQRSTNNSTNGMNNSFSGPVVLPHGRSVLFLMPLQLGAGWNANSVFTREFLPRASTALKSALRSAGRFSIVDVLRSDPIIQRGLADELFSEEDYQTLLKEPTIENANAVVSKITVDQIPKLGFSGPPQIVQFVLDRFPAQTGRPSVQIVARLYDIGLNTPTRTLTVLASTQMPGMTPQQLTLSSTTAGFNRIAQEFAKPAAEGDLPFLPTPVLPAAPVVAPAAPKEGATDVPATDVPATDVPAADDAAPPKEVAPENAGGGDNPA